MPIRLHTVDAFTDRAFSGNPAAVCLLDTVVEAGWMQQVAAEMNLSETAFLFRRRCEVPTAFDLRWFTPKVEVDLCGHATLASAHVLWATGELALDEPARFHTRSGLLTSRRVGELIELDFPANPPAPLPDAARMLEALGAALGVVPVSLHRGGSDLLVELAEAAQVAALVPDLRALAAVEARGVMVTAPGAEGVDFVSRFFAPRVGVDEDPVTGSAHCALAPFWAARLGRETLRARQLSARGGALEVEVRGARVLLRGAAVSVLRGELLVSLD